MLQPESIAAVAAKACDEKLGNDVLILDLRELTVMTDYFVVASAETEVQVRAMVDAVATELEVAGLTWKRREGVQDARWVLLDYGDVVVHIFREADRDFYDLERLWGDAPRLLATQGPEPHLTVVED